MLYIENQKPIFRGHNAILTKLIWGSNALKNKKNKSRKSYKESNKQFTKPIAFAVTPNLTDKNQLIKNECQNCG